MRDLLILAIVVGLLPFAVAHTWIGVMLWTWLSIMNPHKLAFGFAYDAPFAAAAAAATLLSLVVSRDKKQMAWDPPVKALIVFLLWMCITTLFSPSPADAWPQLSKVLKIQLMTLIAIAALHERKHIELFVWVNVLSIGFFGLKGGVWTLLHGGGGRVWGPPGGFIEGNNELGVALVMTIPLMNFLRLVATRRWVRRGLVLLMALCAASALGTQSRGAVLAISAMALMFWFRSTNKVASGLALSGLAIALVLFMPASWDERMSTIKTYEEDSSAMARIEAWKFAFRVANDKPFGGIRRVHRRELCCLQQGLGAPAGSAQHLLFGARGARLCRIGSLSRPLGADIPAERLAQKEESGVRRVKLGLPSGEHVPGIPRRLRHRRRLSELGLFRLRLQHHCAARGREPLDCREERIERAFRNACFERASLTA